MISILANYAIALALVCDNYSLESPPPYHCPAIIIFLPAQNKTACYLRAYLYNYITRKSMQTSFGKKIGIFKVLQ